MYALPFPFLVSSGSFAAQLCAFLFIIVAHAPLVLHVIQYDVVLVDKVVSLLFVNAVLQFFTLSFLGFSSVVELISLYVR